MNFKQLLINTISPPKCLACDKMLGYSSTAMFCYECSKTYRLNTEPFCAVCGKPVGENADYICAECKSHRVYYERNVSRYLYKGCVKDAVQNMKFKRRRWIAFEFGRALCKTVEQSYADIDFDMVIPVPMTWFLELRRGFNQSYEIARIVASKNGVLCADNVLKKRMGAKTQSGLSKKDRLQNVKDKFKVVNGDKLVDKVVLLVDDVYTTGATMNECARVLKKAGAHAVYGLTVATSVFDE